MGRLKELLDAAIEEDLSSWSGWSLVEGLDLSEFISRRGILNVRRVAANGWFHEGLTHFTLSEVFITAPVLAEALTHERVDLRSMRTLKLRGCRFGDAGWRACMDALTPDSLASLDLSHDGLTRVSSRLIAEERAFSGLTRLDLRGNALTDDDVAELKRAAHLSGCDIPT